MKWTVRKRLIGLSAVSMALVLSVGLVGWWTLPRAAQETAKMAVSVEGIRHHLGIQAMLDALHADALGVVSGVSPVDQRRATASLHQHLDRLAQHRDRLSRIAVDHDLAATLRDIGPELERYAGLAAGLAERIERGDRAGAQAALPALLSLYAQLEPRLERVSDAFESAGQAHARDLAHVAAAGQALSVVIPLLAVLALLVLANVVRRSITKPLDDVVRVMDSVADGELDARANPKGDDELGRLGHAVNRALDSLTQALSGIARNAVAVGNASEELAAVSQQLSANAHETSAQSAVVSSASEQVNANVRLVAASAHQVGASIREVAQNAHEAAAVAATAVRVAGEADATVQKLGESSQQVENVVRVITTIAEQTNILALNAEIEAARAGEAGKGFAVVANEVKELAKETARATEDIGQRIDAIQADARAAVSTIGEIVRIIDRISTTQTAIATAVEQQSAATGEITRNMGEAARGTAEIAETISTVARSTESTSAGARETKKAANELAMMAAELQRLAGQFSFRLVAPGAGHAAPAPRTASARVRRDDGVQGLREAA